MEERHHAFAAEVIEHLKTELAPRYLRDAGFIFPNDPNYIGLRGLIIGLRAKEVIYSAQFIFSTSQWIVRRTPRPLAIAYKPYGEKFGRGVKDLVEILLALSRGEEVIFESLETFSPRDLPVTKEDFSFNELEEVLKRLGKD